MKIIHHQSKTPSTILIEQENKFPKINTSSSVTYSHMFTPSYVCAL